MIYEEICNYIFNKFDFYVTDCGSETSEEDCISWEFCPWCGKKIEREYKND